MMVTTDIMVVIAASTAAWPDRRARAGLLACLRQRAATEQNARYAAEAPNDWRIVAPYIRVQSNKRERSLKSAANLLTHVGHLRRQMRSQVAGQRRGSSCLIISSARPLFDYESASAADHGWSAQSIRGWEDKIAVF